MPATLTLEWKVTVTSSSSSLHYLRWHSAFGAAGEIAVSALLAKRVRVIISYCNRCVLRSLQGSGRAEIGTGKQMRVYFRACCSILCSSSRLGERLGRGGEAKKKHNTTQRKQCNVSAPEVRARYVPEDTDWHTGCWGGGAVAKNNWRRIDCCVRKYTHAHARAHAHRAHTHTLAGIWSLILGLAQMCVTGSRARARQMRPVFGWKLDAENRH